MEYTVKCLWMVMQSLFEVHSQVHLNGDRLVDGKNAKQLHNQGQQIFHLNKVISTSSMKEMSLNSKTLHWSHFVCIKLIIQTYKVDFSLSK